MSQVDIQVFRIGHTQVDQAEVHKWMERLGVTGSLADGETTDPAQLIALAAKRCYMSFEAGLNPNVTRVRSDMVSYFDNILRSGHGSVLEHAVYTYAIEGVSRVFTAEMNRHRAGWAISEGSLRFIRFDEDVPYWLPDSLRENPADDDDLKYKKIKSRIVFNRVFMQAASDYSELVDIWDMEASDKNFDYKKKVTSCLRRIIPMGVATGGVWSGNIRAFRHVIALRTDPAAEEEIAHVFRLIGTDIVNREPMLFQDFERRGGKDHTQDSWVPENWKV